MSNSKRLEDVKTELSKLAQAAALTGDFQGYKDIRTVLTGIDKGDRNAIDKAFNIYATLIGFEF